MINKIEINNIRSIKRCVLDFKAAKYKFLENNIEGSIVNPIAMYGHNGSGKSSVIYAIDQLVSLMINSPDSLLPFMCNYFDYNDVVFNKNKQIDQLVSSIGIDFEINNKKFIYEISTSVSNEIIQESLICNNNIIFTRNLNQLIYNGQQMIADINSLFPLLRLLYLEKSTDNDVKDAYEFISNIAVIHADKKKFNIKSLLTKSYMDLMVEKSSEMKDLLKKYSQFPIFSINKKETNNMVINNMNNSNNYYIELECDDRKKELPFAFMSSGMHNQSFMLSVLLSLPENAVLFVDEIEDALHPSTIHSFLDIVRERKVQLFFTSHNTNLLQQLRPDQVFFAKWKNGYSSYYKLSTIYPNIREINNLEKMYLSNLFEDSMNDE